MKEHRLTWPMLGLIAGTRMALGAGVALLLAEWLDREQRQAIGWSLFTVGLMTTIPLIAQVMGEVEKTEQGEMAEGSKEEVFAMT